MNQRLARQRVLDRYSLDRNLEALAELYEEVISEAPVKRFTRDATQ